MNPVKLFSMGLNKEKLTSLMKERGLNPRSLSVAAGLGATALRDILEGRTKNPRIDTVAAIAKVLKVHPEDLTHNLKLTPPKDYVQINKNTLEIPVFDALVSAGHGASWGEPQITGYLPMSRERVKRLTSAPEKNLAYVEIMGDSMEPKLFAGDVVLVDTTPTRGASGSVFIINDGEYLIAKELRINPPKATLISYNPAYDPIEKDLSDLKIVGRVLAKWGAI
jgi:phage repressor protein C with HTH and peptisase S24 domain